MSGALKLPATPADAFRGFLDALNVPPERIPPLPDAQSGLYRSVVAERRMLIVVDRHGSGRAAAEAASRLDADDPGFSVRAVFSWSTGQHFLR